MPHVPLHFWKYHGIGNDFVVVESGPLMSPGRAECLCDRHTGIGADGVLTILPPEEGGAAYMHIYNSDGSEAAMCGNGVRCVARHLAESRGLDGDIAIETASGMKRCSVHRGASRAVEAVTVDMGRARVEGEQVFELGAETFRAVRVSMGNPHAVVFDPGTAERAASLGPAIEARVPGGINVGFARLEDSAMDLVVWERGAGLTAACGTGACAAVAAALHSGRLRAGGPVTVRLPGGALTITVGPDRSVLMRGPAERVFEGETDL